MVAVMLNMVGDLIAVVVLIDYVVVYMSIVCHVVLAQIRFVTYTLTTHTNCNRLLLG